MRIPIAVLLAVRHAEVLILKLNLKFLDILHEQKEIINEQLCSNYFDPSDCLSGHVLRKEYFTPSQTGDTDQR